jgi:REP element-mobilizing transposase RayT
MSKYMNKYRSESARAQWWDYGWNGAYFITICTADREHFFGEIKNGKMILSPTGVIADLLWHEIKNHSKFVELGDFVVMPNHIHGILILDKPKTTTIGETKQTIDKTVFKILAKTPFHPSLVPINLPLQNTQID